MTWLIWLALASWVAVAAYMAPAAWSIYVKIGRRGDPARLVCLLFALLSVAGLGRRLILQDTDVGPALATLLVAHITVAAFTAYTARSYGRGPRV